MLIGAKFVKFELKRIFTFVINSFKLGFKNVSDHNSQCNVAWWSYKLNNTLSRLGY